MPRRALAAVRRYAVGLSSFARVLRRHNRLPIRRRLAVAATAAGWLGRRDPPPGPSEAWPRSLRAIRPTTSITLVSLLSLLLLVVALSWLASSVSPPPKDWQDTAGSLLTVAEVLGGIVALAVAAIVFATEQGVARLGRLKFLAPYALRRRRLLPAVAAALSVVGMNVLSGLLSPMLAGPLPRVGWVPLVAAGLDGLLVPAVLLMVAHHLHHALLNHPGDLFRSDVHPAVLAAHADHLKHGHDTGILADINHLVADLPATIRNGTPDDLTNPLKLHADLVEQYLADPTRDSAETLDLPLYLRGQLAEASPSRRVLPDAAYTARRRGSHEHFLVLHRTGSGAGSGRDQLHASPAGRPARPTCSR